MPAGNGWTTVALSLASVIAVSLVSLVGVITLSMRPARIRQWATFFVSFAVGALLGDAFIHLIPEAFAPLPGGATRPDPSLLVLAGIMAFFILEKLLRHRHGVLHAHHHGDAPIPGPVLAKINIFGDAIHNFIDGLLIGGSYLASPTLGISTTIAILLHEVPQEFGDFGILVHGGMSVRQALLANLGSASVAILGTVLALVIGSGAGEHLTAVLIPVMAGGFIYLAAADLIPELQHDRTLRALIIQAALICAGIGVMQLLTLIE